MNELVIGYDIRQASRKAWPDQFLLKPVLRVRSVDKYVWPSCGDGIEFVAPISSPPLNEGVLVAITWVQLPEADSDHAKYFQHLNQGCVPRSLPQTSKLIGYDVCDRTLLSGLLDCAYSAEEQDSLTPHWSSKLNSVHLFTDPKDAASFATLTAQRVPEHAPFFVFGLYESPMPK